MTQMISQRTDLTFQYIQEYANSAQCLREHASVKKCLRIKRPATKQMEPNAVSIKPTSSWSGIGTIKKLAEKLAGVTTHTLNRVHRNIVELYSSKHEDPTEISRMTVLGDLPNDPTFENAINTGKGMLSKKFDIAMKETTINEQECVMELLADIDLSKLQRGGKPLEMTQKQFLTALMLGCHFVVNDNGMFADSLQEVGGDYMEKRGSSHYLDSPAPQYGMDLPGGIGHLLLGKTDSGQTFFQLEAHGLGNSRQTWGEWVSEVGGHSRSWFQHVGSSSSYVQIGPHGAIEGSEKDGNHVVIG